jgi:hypothetical protein
MQGDDGREGEHGLTANPPAEIATFDKLQEWIHRGILCFQKSSLLAVGTAAFLPVE